MLGEGQAKSLDCIGDFRCCPVQKDVCTCDEGFLVQSHPLVVEDPHPVPFVREDHVDRIHGSQRSQKMSSFSTSSINSPINVSMIFSTGSESSLQSHRLSISSTMASTIPSRRVSVLLHAAFRYLFNAPTTSVTACA